MKSSTSKPNDSALDVGKLRVLLLGATGTAGRATAQALVDAGHQVSCLVRANSTYLDVTSPEQSISLPEEIEILIGDVTDHRTLEQTVFPYGRFDALVSCLASRTGVAADAWAIDHAAHSAALAAAKASGVQQMVLLSAICVQKPLLAFQQAKLAFEKELINSGLTYSIVRPTAFFKSLSGQIERVRHGKAFFLFGDGSLTACKPISDADLGRYMEQCLVRSDRHNKILPIGGPGNAMTLRQQGDLLFRLTGQTPRFKKVPIALFDGIRIVLEQLGHVSSACARKAELARIGRYYATESMLALNPDTGCYDADLTPSTGTDTLEQFYTALLDGSVVVDRGEHAIFKEPA